MPNSSKEIVYQLATKRIITKIIIFKKALLDENRITFDML